MSSSTEPMIDEDDIEPKEEIVKIPIHPRIEKTFVENDKRQKRVPKMLSRKKIKKIREQKRKELEQKRKEITLKILQELQEERLSKGENPNVTKKDPELISRVDEALKETGLVEEEIFEQESQEDETEVRFVEKAPKYEKIFGHRIEILPKRFEGEKIKPKPYHKSRLTHQDSIMMKKIKLQPLKERPKDMPIRLWEDLKERGEMRDLFDVELMVPFKTGRKTKQKKFQLKRPKRVKFSEFVEERKIPKTRTLKYKVAALPEPKTMYEQDVPKLMREFVKKEIELLIGAKSGKKQPQIESITQLESKNSYMQRMKEVVAWNNFGDKINSEVKKREKLLRQRAEGRAEQMLNPEFIADELQRLYGKDFFNLNIYEMIRVLSTTKSITLFSVLLVRHLRSILLSEEVSIPSFKRGVLTEHLIDRFINLDKRKKSLKKIANELNTTIENVKLLNKMMGISSKKGKTEKAEKTTEKLPKGVTQSMMTKLRNISNKYISVKSLAFRLGTDESTVKKMLTILKSEEKRVERKKDVSPETKNVIVGDKLANILAEFIVNFYKTHKPNKDVIYNRLVLDEKQRRFDILLKKFKLTKEQKDMINREYDELSKDAPKPKVTPKGKERNDVLRYENWAYENSTNVFDYLYMALFPVMYISERYLGRYAKFISEVVKFGRLSILEMPEASLTWLFPELAMNTQLSDDEFKKALKIIEEIHKTAINDFIERYIELQDLTRRRYQTGIRIHDDRISKYIVSIHEKCENDGYENTVNKKGELIHDESEQIPLKKLVICMDDKKKFSCQSIDMIIRRHKAGMTNPFTGKKYPEKLINRFKKRYAQRFKMLKPLVIPEPRTVEDISYEDETFDTQKVITNPTTDGELETALKRFWGYESVVVFLGKRKGKDRISEFAIEKVRLTRHETNSKVLVYDDIRSFSTYPATFFGVKKGKLPMMAVISGKYVKRKMTKDELMKRLGIPTLEQPKKSEPEYPHFIVRTNDDELIDDLSYYSSVDVKKSNTKLSVKEMVYDLKNMKKVKGNKDIETLANEFSGLGKSNSPEKDIKDPYPLEDVQMMDHIYFGSGCKSPYHKLSNLYAAPIKLCPEDVTESMVKVNPNISEWLTECVVFPSAEHLWHSFKSKDIETFKMFYGDGKLAKFDEESFKPMYKEKSGAKYKWWSKKNMSGIIPKVATGKIGMKKYGLELISKNERLDAELEKSIWMDILLQKYKQNEKLGKLLKSTKDKTLVEFSRMAKSKGSYWGGLVYDGKLYGTNIMGQYLMAVREQL